MLHYILNTLYGCIFDLMYFELTFYEIGKYIISKVIFCCRQGIVLNHNMSARIIRSNQSLVLQRVTRQSAGRYVCSAVNSEGETLSNELAFRVQCKYYLPQQLYQAKVLPPPTLLLESCDTVENL